MKYMLDTNICIFLMKKKSPALIQKFLGQNPEDISISAITYAELMHGVEKSLYPDKNRLALTLFLSPIAILPFTEDAAIEYGAIRATLERNGTPIGPMDMLIAAHAKALNLIVVTNNTREFQRVEGITLEDWTIDKG